MIHYVTRRASISVSTTFDRAAGEVIVKLVNPLLTPVETSLVLHNCRKD